MTDEDREKKIRETAELLGVSEVTAAFMLGQELGEITGDVIEVDDDGNEVKPEND